MKWYYCGSCDRPFKDVDDDMVVSCTECGEVEDIALWHGENIADNDLDVFVDPCPVCRKRKATQLCDYVIRYDHPIIFFRDYKRFQEMNEKPQYETCDLPICEECSHQVGVNIDLCPIHYKTYKDAVLLPLKYRYAQMESKRRRRDEMLSEEEKRNG